MNTININQIVNDIKETGYSRVPDFITADISEQLEKELGLINNTEYTQENLLKRIAYKREEGNNRQGDAYMVSSEENPLGSILVKDQVLDIFNVYNKILEVFTGKKMAKNSRAMMNCQQYFEKSSAVYDHYDGYYLDFEHQGEGDDKALIINKALLPRLVAVIVLRNENDNGTYIRKQGAKDRIDIPNKAFDLIIFDNIKMRHGVPPLEKPRMMIGFRNFDHYPLMFQREVNDGWLLQDEINPGYVREITDKESEMIQMEFLEEWNSGLAEEQLEKDAAF